MLSLLPKLPRPMVRAIVGMWHRRWMIVAIAWVASILGWGLVTLIPDYYESRAQVYINTDTALDSTISDVGARPNLEKGVRIIRTQLLSRDNIEQVIYETGMDADITGPVELERRIEYLSNNIDVQSEEEQYFVIRFWHRDPVMAQRVVSSVLDLFIEQNLVTAIADVDKALASLGTEIAQRKADLEKIDEEIYTFRRLNANELAGSSRISRRLETREEELGRIQDQASAVSLRMGRIRNSLSNTPRYASGSDLDTLKLQLASLQSQFNDNYPDIQRLKAQIAGLESGSSVLPTNPQYLALQQDLRSAQDEMRSLQGREDRLQRELDELTLDVAQTPEAESALLALLRDKEQVERTYKQLVSEQAEMDVYAKLNAAGGAIEYRRFEAPKVAAEPSSPNRGLLTMGVLVVAIGMAASLAFVMSQLDKTYTQGKDLEESLGLQVLGSVSPAPTRKHLTAVLFDRAGLMGTLGALVLTAGGIYWWYEINVTERRNSSPPEQTASLEWRGMR